MNHRTKYVSRKVMAKLLGVHPNTLDNLRKRNEGPPFVRLGSRLIRYTLNDDSQPGL